MKKFYSSTPLAAALLLGAILPGCSPKSTNATEAAAMHPDSLLLLIGSYSSPQEEGISLYGFNQSTGRFSRLTGMRGISNPSYQVISPSGTRIYSVGEDEGTSSTINTIAFNPDSLRLTLLSSVPAQGGAPCHINLSPDGSQVLTANYLGGNATLYPLDANGVPTGTGSSIDFASDSSNPSHAHFATFTPDGHKLWVTDLGLDRIHTFPVTDGAASLDSATMTDIVLPEGAGPRHAAFHPNLSLAYVIDELDGQVNVIDYATTLHPTVVQRVAADTVGAHGSADIHISPDGRFLYASNRLKADGIAIFSIDPRTGTLTRVGYQLTGPHPRNFVITPNGRYLLVACRDSNAVELYTIDPATGLLTPASQAISTTRPVCLRFFPQ